MARHRSVEETPRGRIIRRGATSLSDAELLGLILQINTEVAATLLEEIGGLRALAISNGGLARDYGLAKETAVIGLAVVELSRRLARARVPKRFQVNRPGTLAQYLLHRYCRGDQEIFGALFLDIQSRVLHEAEIFRGTLTRTAVEPRAILRLALRHKAAQMVLFHTHPSGNPIPSEPDIAFTKRMTEAADLIGVRLLDHIILGDDGNWESLRRNEAIK